MFYYFGAKRRIAGKYPVPRFDTIVEPFAGSASYAMHYRDRDVILVEKDPFICDVWRYLITASPADILRLPLYAVGDRVDTPGLLDVEKYIIRSFAAPGARPGYVVQPFSKWNERQRAKVARRVQDVRHWKIIGGEYTDSPNIEATWFVDPPYEVGGEEYRFGNAIMDYRHLLTWCKDRLGQLIVCENDKNTWLPSYRPLAAIKTVAGKRMREVIFERGGHEMELIA